uniref:Uncharacterized protein n=1 Tax=Aegilops tauschii subsp. strangulata TaxID=200361 RepID=A0A453SNL1_AEGTS
MPSTDNLNFILHHMQHLSMDFRREVEDSCLFLAK